MTTTYKKAMTRWHPTNKPSLLEQDFYWACAACCWDTVSNPGLIAMRWVQRAPLWTSVYCVNRRSHSKSKFGDREQDLTSPGVRASATSKADRDLGSAWFSIPHSRRKKGLCSCTDGWPTIDLFSLYVLCFQEKSCHNTLGNCFFQISFHSRAYVRIIYEQTKGQVPPGPLLRKQNTQANEVYLKASKIH